MFIFWGNMNKISTTFIHMKIQQYVMYFFIERERTPEAIKGHS